MTTSTMVPPVLRLDEFAHRAFLGDRELVRVTTALEEAGKLWFKDPKLTWAALILAFSLCHVPPRRLPSMRTEADGLPFRYRLQPG